MDKTKKKKRVGRSVKLTGGREQNENNHSDRHTHTHTHTHTKKKSHRKYDTVYVPAEALD